ncbi:MAG: Uma2 family endonuclease [Cytophagales bacterium]|nr:Uma2 family endonuclease [Armatimonadota bacterium]
MSVISLPDQAQIPQHVRASNNRFHWTVDTFYRAVDAGVFDEPKRLELVYDGLREKETANPPHAATTRRVSRHVQGLFEPQFIVHEEKPVRLGNDTEPLPDIAVVSGADEDYELRHPNAQDVILLIEVADTTTDYDTGEKARMYARSGVNDYWVVLISQRELVVFRSPTTEGYASQMRLTETDSIALLAAPDITISVRDLLPRASPTTSVQEG